jgi:anti-repressor protein
MMDELIAVVERKKSRAVNARELHAALKVKRDFSNWIKARVKKRGFEEGKDYSPHAADRSDGSPGKPRTGYLLSLSVAKEVYAAENSDVGRAMRRYLLKAEEAWHTPEPVVARALEALTKSLETCRDKLAALEGENGEVKARNAAPPPRAEYYERLVSAHSLTDIHDTVKGLSIPEKRFIEFPLHRLRAVGESKTKEARKMISEKALEESD